MEAYYLSSAYFIGLIVMAVGFIAPLGVMIVKNKKTFKRNSLN